MTYSRWQIPQFHGSYVNSKHLKIHVLAEELHTLPDAREKSSSEAAVERHEHLISQDTNADGPDYAKHLFL